ncbi:MAG: rhomboid family intramembrane serine protease [Clostridiales bacterium]|nr:rhomboid family intramembrane serine protease [Clostridiales bacterium]
MKKKLKLTFNSPLVLCFAILCTLVTLIGALTDKRSTYLLFSTGGTNFADPLTYLRLFTHVLGHADAAHLVGNMAYILLLGPALEERYGAKNLLIIILATALITGLVHNLIFPNTYLLGASGVVFAFILLTSFTEFREGEIPLTVILVAAIYLGQQIWEGVTQKDNVSNLTHIIGGLVGGGAGYLLNRGKGKKGRF